MRLAWVGAGVTAIMAAQLVSAGQRWRERPPPGPSPEEREAAAWVTAHLAPDAVIAAVGDGQRIGYYTRRPTVAIPNGRFTARTWDDAALRAAVVHYRVQVLVVTGEEGAAFMNGGIPAWLTAEPEGAGMRVYRIRSDTARAHDDGGTR